jgi:hypothetical protein
MKSPFIKMKLSARERKELAISEVVLIILALIGLGVIVWLAWFTPSQHRNTNDKKDGAITSYNGCVAAGNPVQESYPGVCVTKDGKRFVNPEHAIQRLTIKEWDVTALITGVSDAYYAFDRDEQTVFLSTKTLDATVEKMSGCTSGLHGLTYERLQPGARRPDGAIWDEATLARQGAHVDGHYYLEKAVFETACLPTQNDASRMISDIQEHLRVAFRSLTAAQ